MTVLGGNDGCCRVDFLDGVLNLGKHAVVVVVVLVVLVGQQIHFVENNLVGKGNLFNGFINDIVGFDFGQARQNLGSIHDGNDAVQLVTRVDDFILKKSLHNGPWIGETGRFEQDTIQTLLNNGLIEIL